MSQQAKANVSETSSSSPPPTPSYRVKVYCLDATGKWEDKGTGFCVYLEGGGNDPDEIFVRSETDSTPLLSSIVHAERSYQKQQDTLIVWTELDKEDLALSFQDAESCEEIWLRIHSNNKTGQDELSKLNDLLDDDHDDTASILPVNETLPPPKRSNLNKIVTILTNATVLQEKDELANFVLTDGYINKLFPIFESCEKAKKIKKLHQLYTIMKSIILLKDSSVIEYLVGDDTIVNVAGMLEYDTSTPTVKANHRQVLEKQAQMELVVPLDDATTLSKMRQTFRLQYLKDVIMAKYLDETLASMLQSLILFNHIDIIGHIQYNSKFLTDLFDLIKPSSIATSVQKAKAVQFVLQLCNISKSLQSGTRLLLFRTLARYGLFDAIELALAGDNDGMHQAGVGALSSIVDMDVSLLRTHILEQQQQQQQQQQASEEEDNDTSAKEKPKKKKKKADLLACIVQRFTMAKDSGLKFQYGDVLKMLLETNTTTPPGALSTKVVRKQMAGIDDILGVFYEKYAMLLLRPLQTIENKPMKLDGPIELLEFDQEEAELYNHLLDFLCFAVQQHGFRSKYFMLSSDCFPKVAQLYRARLTWVKLCALRFFRTCVGLLDDFFNRHLIKHNIFESTIRMLLDTDGKANLLNSACLELIEFIRNENPKLLVTHLIERFGSVLDTIDYISTCSLLRLQYDENQDRPNASTSHTTSERFENGSNHGSNDTPHATATSSLDQFEEGYFNESEEDEDDEKLEEIGNKIDDFIVTSTSPLSPPKRQRTKKDNKPADPHVDELDDSDDDSDDDDAPDPASKKLKLTKNDDDALQPPLARIITFINKHVPEGQDALETDEELALTDSNGVEHLPQHLNGDSEDTGSKTPTDDENKRIAATTTSPPPPPRRRHDDEDDEDDVLAAKTSKRPCNTPTKLSSDPSSKSTTTPTSMERKKIVIKTQLKKPT